MEQTAKAQKQLAGNALSGMVATIIYMVSRLLLTPLILHYISLAEFGLWSLSFIILSYAGMGGFGVNSTYIRYAARYLADGREKEISKLLSTGVAYMLSFSLLFCTILFLIMPFILESFHIQDAQKTLASTVFLGTAA
ncbi:MAG: polysaccharide biosynthesis protein, partial [Chlorobiales bacterium]|nr:polysaccharide biosynthesis protein [Chlorobiales bacterium]